jgi:hypothetical protein
MRGGKRDGSGRPSSWKDSDTATIRIPKSIQPQVLEFARQLDALEPEEALWQISAPHFCAALIVAGEKVKDAAPILKWSIGKDWPWVRDYCKGKKWSGKRVAGGTQ